MSITSKITKIRSKKFTDKAKQEKAVDIFKTVADKGYEELPVLSATQEFGMIKRTETGINIQHDTRNETGYKRVQPGQFVVHLRSFQGGFAHSVVEGITSPAYTVLDFKVKEEHYDYYWKYIFSSEAFIKRLELITYGIRDGRSIKFEDFSTLNFYYPVFEEQKFIGTYMQMIDRLLLLQKSKIIKLQNTKKAMLDKMFPKKGSKVPEIRFDGFTDDWEQCKLGERTDLITGYPFGSKKFIDNGVRLIRGMNVKRGFLDLSSGTSQYWHTYKGLESYLLKNKDILIQMDGALIGKSYAQIEQNQLPALLVQRVTRVRSKTDDVDIDFVYQAIQNSFLSYINGLKTETAVPHLSLKDINDFVVSLPTLKEQIKIGRYFTKLDNLITLHQYKLEKLQNIKKACLEKMFI